MERLVLQSCLRALALGDVAHANDELATLTNKHLADRQLQRERGAIAALADCFARRRGRRWLRPIMQNAAGAEYGRARWSGEQPVERLAHHLTFGIAENFFSGAVERADVA